MEHVANVVVWIIPMHSPPNVLHFCQSSILQSEQTHVNSCAMLLSSLRKIRFDVHDVRTLLVADEFLSIENARVILPALRRWKKLENFQVKTEQDYVLKDIKSLVNLISLSCSFSQSPW